MRRQLVPAVSLELQKCVFFLEQKALQTDSWKPKGKHNSAVTYSHQRAQIFSVWPMLPICILKTTGYQPQPVRNAGQKGGKRPAAWCFLSSFEDLHWNVVRDAQENGFSCTNSVWAGSQKVFQGMKCQKLVFRGRALELSAVRTLLKPPWPRSPDMGAGHRVPPCTILWEALRNPSGKFTV